MEYRSRQFIPFRDRPLSKANLSHCSLADMSEESICDFCVCMWCFEGRTWGGGGLQQDQDFIHHSLRAVHLTDKLSH